MTAPEMEPSRPGGVLDPVERLSEILFGLIMALTFTGSIHAGSDGEEEIRTVLVGAIGCNIAWGIVDAVMYLVTGLVTRTRVLKALRELRDVTNRERAAAILADILPERAVEVMTPRDFESLHGWIAKLPRQPSHVLTPRDFRGALGVFALVTTTTFPVVVPFLVFDDAVRALRWSNGTALAMLFLIGWALGRHAKMRPLLTGLSMLGIGAVLVALTILLGG